MAVISAPAPRAWLPASLLYRNSHCGSQIKVCVFLFGKAANQFNAYRFNLAASQLTEEALRIQAEILLQRIQGGAHNRQVCQSRCLIMGMCQLTLLRNANIQAKTLRQLLNSFVKTLRGCSLGRMLLSGRILRIGHILRCSIKLPVCL